MDKKHIKKIKEDFEFISDKVLGVLVYGSRVKGEVNNRSDIDICIVAPNNDPFKLYKETLPLDYDIKIFENMPLFLKMEVIHNHKVIYTGDIYSLYEYFYGFRKIWNDEKHRQKISKKEALQIFS